MPLDERDGDERTLTVVIPYYVASMLERLAGELERTEDEIAAEFLEDGLRERLAAIERARYGE